MAVRSQVLERSRKAKLRRKMHKVTILISLLFILGIVLVYVLNQPGLRIQRVQVVGTRSVNDADVVATIQNELADRYFFIIPRSNIFFWPKETITSVIRQTFPRLDRLTFSLAGSVLKVDVTEKDSQILWCRVSQTDKDCYFIDEAGIAFAKAPVFTDHVFFEITNTINASTTPVTSVINTPVILSKDLAQILEQKNNITNSLAEQKVFDRSIITSVLFGPGKAYTFNVISPGLVENNWQIIVPAATSTQLAVSLKALFISDAFVDTVIRQKNPLAYVDSRLLSKLFFKTKNFHASSTISTP